MYKQKLCIALSDSFGVSVEEQLKLISNAGFDEIFISDCSDVEVDINGIKKLANEHKLGVQSVHAPFGKCATMWNESGDEADIAADELVCCVERCAESEIPIMVSHAFIGFYTGRVPTAAGVERYGRVIKRAGELGVKIAFENTEGDEFLACLLKEFSGEKCVGFCWDSGHEQCYNYSRDLLALYGDRLFSTHLNDNLGISNYEGRIYFTDDLHLLPFDGIIDWKDAAQRLNRCGYNDTLTFELKRISKAGRADNLKYENMPIEEYIAEAYARACRVAFLKTHGGNN